MAKIWILQPKDKILYCFKSLYPLIFFDDILLALILFCIGLYNFAMTTVNITFLCGGKVWGAEKVGAT